MTIKTLHIKNNSQEFLNLVNKLKADKEAKVKALLSKKNCEKGK
jgi:hypothetical protein